MSSNDSNLNRSQQEGQQRELLRSWIADDANYCCPGESLPITKAVHLARLRRQYPKCRSCPHRNDAAAFSHQEQQSIVDSWNRDPVSGAQFEDGVRGVMYREFHQEMLAELLENIAHRASNLEGIDADSPVIILGHDAHGFSLEMAAFSVEKLRTCGLGVISLGVATVPVLTFAARSLKAAVEILITADPEPSRYAGVEVFGPGGMPWSSESLQQLCAQEVTGAMRQTRQDAGVQQVSVVESYVQSLQPAFPKLNLSQVTIEAENPFIQKILDRLLAESRSDEEQKNNSVSSEGVPEIVLWIDQSGERCLVYDQHGERWPTTEVVSLLAARMLDEGDTIILGEGLDESLKYSELRRSYRIRTRQSLREHFAHGMRTSQAKLGWDDHDRCWIGGTPPLCDGLLTAGLLLQILTDR